jgi:hypothetical protein
MNDDTHNTPTNPQSGEAVIARLRSALDEVAAGTDQSDVDIVPLHSRPPTPRRWLGIAAATVLLAGGATIALTQRSPDGGPVTRPELTTSLPTTTAPSEATSPAASTSTTILDEPAQPWFALEMPGFVAGEVFHEDGIEPTSDQLNQSWMVGSGEDRGFLTVKIESGLTPGVEGDYTVETLEVPEGIAYFLRPNGDDAPLDYGNEVRWFHDDGTAWLFQSQGLDRDTVVGLALSAVPGSGVPLVIDDPSLTMLSIGTTVGEQNTQDYTNETGLVRLWVERRGTALGNLISAANIIDVTVAGTPGYAALLSNNQIDVTWPADNGWWGHLSIAPALSRGADGIIAAVVPASLDHPSPPSSAP